MPWSWIERETVLNLQEEQLAEHGGGAGVRDHGLLDSALVRPLNLEACGELDAAAFAAAYAFGIARNHPFVDGNRRAAAVVMETILALHGFLLTCNDGELVVTFLALAAGELAEEELAQWLREHLRPLG